MNLWAGRQAVPPARSFAGSLCRGGRLARAGRGLGACRTDRRGLDQEVAEGIVAELGWTDRWYLVSAISREGTWPIMKDIMAFFDRQREDALEAEANGGDHSPT